jgi:hypothetical protein
MVLPAVLIGAAACLRRRLGSYLLVAICILHASPARAENAGTMRYSGEAGGVTINFYTEPSPPRVGTVDLNMLVQIPRGLRRSLPAYQVSFYPEGAAAKKRTQPSSPAPIGDKPFHAAELDINEPGAWIVEVQMEVDQAGPVLARFRFVVGEGTDDWSAFAYQVGLPALAIAFFIGYRRFAGRRPSRAGSSSASGSSNKMK